MYIIAYMFTNSEGILEDAYYVRETFEEAWELYKKVAQEEGTHSASVTAVIHSTDYEIAQEFASYEIHCDGKLIFKGETK